MTKEKKTATTLATVSPTQNDIPAMLDLVNEQIKAIKKGLPETPQTDKSLLDYGKIKDIKTVERLVQAASAVIARREYFEKALTEVMPEGLKTPKFRIEEVDGDKWLTDIAARIIVVGHKEQLDKLNKVKKKLEDNLSAEAKLARDLADIQGILKIDGEDEE